MKVESYHDAMKAYKTPMIDWSHSYWRYAELINGMLKVKNGTKKCKLAIN